MGTGASQALDRTGAFLRRQNVQPGFGGEGYRGGRGLRGQMSWILKPLLGLGPCRGGGAESHTCLSDGGGQRTCLPSQRTGTLESGPSPRVPEAEQCQGQGRGEVSRVPVWGEECRPRKCGSQPILALFVLCRRLCRARHCSRV